MYDQEQKTQSVILAAVDTGAYDAQQSLEELSELCRSAGGEPCAMVIQKLQSPVNATYIGGGKLQEIKQLCTQWNADLVIFDDSLTGIQLRNIEEVLDVRVIDRTMLILDIFAMRARSKEGKLQVALAQKKYMLPRLIGLGKQLSRQGAQASGEIGSRGPGETKLELDRRHIRRQIDALTEELRHLERRREQIRRRRKKNDVPIIAIVGYTNVGKSTLLNLLTDAGVLAENQLFATLDPTARELRLPDGQNAVIIDTVGLIRRLPHQLVEAFHSTLEEAANADLILNICDASSEQAEEQAKVTTETLTELGCGGTPVITVLNKADLLPPETLLPSDTGKAVLISAKENLGIDTLLASICQSLSEGMRKVNLLLPYSEAGLLDKIRRGGKIFSEEYREDGIAVTANTEIKLAKLIGPYICE